MIIVIITVSVIAAATAPIFMSGFRAFFWARDVANVNSEAELAMERMAREIRGIDPSNITTCTATQLSFTLSGVSVSYSRNTVQNKLLRTAAGNADLLASNVTGLTFSYYKDDWTTTVTPSEIWSIRFVLQFTGAQATESLRTTVFLRSGNKSR